MTNVVQYRVEPDVLKRIDALLAAISAILPKPATRAGLVRALVSEAFERAPKDLAAVLSRFP